MATFLRVLGVLFLCFATFVFVTWGVGIVTIGPTDHAIYGANVYFIPSVVGFVSALLIWWVMK